MDITSAGHGTLLKVTMPLPRLDPSKATPTGRPTLNTSLGLSTEELGNSGVDFFLLCFLPEFPFTARKLSSPDYLWLFLDLLGFLM